MISYEVSIGLIVISVGFAGFGGYNRRAEGCMVYIAIISGECNVFLYRRWQKRTEPPLI